MGVSFKKDGLVDIGFPSPDPKKKRALQRAAVPSLEVFD